jgi:hypothetical protein
VSVRVANANLSVTSVNEEFGTLIPGDVSCSSNRLLLSGEDASRS